MEEQFLIKDLHLMVSTTPYLKSAKPVFYVIMYYLTVRLQIISSSNVKKKKSWQNLNVKKIMYCVAYLLTIRLG